LHRTSEDGFTLIEVIVVVGIIAVLAGILVPIIFKELDAARISRANADVKAISVAISVFRKDSGRWPLMDNACAENTSMLSGDGNLPANFDAVGFNPGISGSYNDHLTADTNACYGATWQGPYMARVAADPWGNAYITNVEAFSDFNRPVWILSAGPNGQVETTTDSLTVLGDDIGLRIL
jgi:general secretion pathway protein G